MTMTSSWISSLIMRPLGIERSEVNEFFTRKDLEVLIREGTETGALRAQHGSHIFRILRFRSLKARDVMTPRTEIIALESSADVNELRTTALNSGYSKIPIYEKNIDQIIGLLEFIGGRQMHRINYGFAFHQSSPFRKDARSILGIRNSIIIQMPQNENKKTRNQHLNPGLE